MKMDLKSRTYILSLYIVCILTLQQVSSQKKKPLLTPQCGISNAHHDRVVGGNPAELHAWPWIAVLGYGTRSRYSFKCGGTLISARTVITAAHCIDIPDLKFARLGEHVMYDDNDGSNPVDYNIISALVHPDYNDETLENDVALLTLSRNVEFTDDVHPICLPVTENVKNRNFVGSLPFVAGWGATSFKGPASRVLLEAQVPVVDKNTCSQQYANIGNTVIDDTVICAGYTQGGKDACQGDSGGPLMFPVKNTYYLIGVVSSGFQCARPGFPGIYMRVTHYLDFILKNMV